MKQKKRARLTGKLVADGSTPMSGDEIARMEVKEDVDLKISSAVVPIVTLVVVVFLGIWYTGYLDAGGGLLVLEKLLVMEILSKPYYGGP